MGKVELEMEKTYARVMPLLHYSAYFVLPEPHKAIQIQLPTSVIGSKEVGKIKVTIEWDDAENQETEESGGMTE